MPKKVRSHRLELMAETPASFVNKMKQTADAIQLILTMLQWTELNRTSIEGLSP